MADFSESALEQHDELVARHGFERKGAGSAYTSLNGHMFSFLLQRAAWHCASRRKTARPSSANARTASRHFAASVAYVSSLKPNPTTRKRAAGKQAAKKKVSGKQNPTREKAGAKAQGKQTAAGEPARKQAAPSVGKSGARKR